MSLKTLLDDDVKISIIIPAYNVEKYVQRGVSSALHQTFSSVEVVVVDDGSSDSTWDILQTYSGDARMVLARQENSGVSVARNHALDLASGDFVLFLDSDDWLEPDTCEQLIRMQRLCPDSLIAAGAYFVSIVDGEELRADKTVDMATEDLSLDEAILNFGIFNTVHIGSSCYKLFSRDLIENHHLRFDENIAHTEDGLFVFRYLKLCNGLHYEPLPLWNILERPGSATTSGYSCSLLTSLDAIDQMIGYPENSPEIVRHLRHFKVHEAVRILGMGIDSGQMSLNEEVRLINAIRFTECDCSRLSGVDKVRRAIYLRAPHFASKVFNSTLRFVKKRN